ncbi:polysaccharide biosynthesis/export family protein [Shimia sp. SDUM112013]|uniref:polysaccharide biosynthesis/export family protein n=1 Tax=Shimia sp. SDUM112013 TaxID=3136160 RepID=UPI0032ED4BBE
MTPQEMRRPKMYSPENTAQIRECLSLDDTIPLWIGDKKAKFVKFVEWRQFAQREQLAEPLQSKAVSNLRIERNENTGCDFFPSESKKHCCLRSAVVKRSQRKGGEQSVMTSGFKLVAVLCAVGLLAACSLPRGAPTTQEVIGSNEEDFAERDISVVEVSRGNVNQIASWPRNGWHGHYHWLAAERGPRSNVIRPGDNLSLLIWDNSDNSLLTGIEQRNVEMPLIEVSASGTIFVPYVEEVQVAGLTANEARKLLQERLANIAPSIQVQVAMEEGVSNSVDAVSGFANPGTYTLPNRNYSIRSLIAKAGGIDPSLVNPIVRLSRGGSTYEIPAKELFRSPSKNAILRGGDQVFAEEDQRYFTVMGAAQRESIVYFPKETVNGVEAVTIAGGILDTRANAQGLLVLREYPDSAVRMDASGPSNKYVVFVMNLTTADGLFGARNFEIQPEDTVIATESVLNSAQAVIAFVGTAFAIANVFN